MAENHYMVFKTKEDFDKIFKEIYDDGYNRGYKEGLATSLGYIYAAIDEDFDAETRQSAEYEARRISMNKWRRKQAMYDDIKKTAVNEYIKSLDEDNKKEG